VAAIVLGLRLFAVIQVLRRIRMADYAMVLAYVRLIYPIWDTWLVFSQERAILNLVPRSASSSLVG
jgi:hypothetical protein